MKTRKEQEKKINSLPDGDKEAITVVETRLKNLKSKKLITEESLAELETTVLELMNMKDRHQKYLMRWLKQGYILD